MIEELLRRILTESVARLFSAGLINQSHFDCNGVTFRSRNSNRGDYSSPIAFRLAASASTTPLKIAQLLAEEINQSSQIGIQRIEVVDSGHINFFLGKNWLCLALQSMVSDVPAFLSQSADCETPKPPGHLADMNIDRKLNDGNPGRVYAHQIQRLQYLHAYSASLLRRCLEPYLDLEELAYQPPKINQIQWQQFLIDCALSAALFEKAFDSESEVFNRQKGLVLTLESISSAVGTAWSPHTFNKYVLELGAGIDTFYAISPIVSADKSVMKARLGVVLAIKQVLAKVLGIIGLPALERL